MIPFGITDHLEAPRDVRSSEVYDRIVEQTILADHLGFDYAWFAEHHAHAHQGHLPAPLLLALHVAGETERIRLGTAIICLNLHHPLAVAEQTAVADLLCGGRLSPGFGSGSTPEEFALFGLPVTEEQQRHEQFAAALRLIQSAWRGHVDEPEGRAFRIAPHAFLPVASKDLTGRSWVAVNSIGAARIAGRFGFNMLFSHLRTPAQYRQYRSAYHDAGGRGLVAANRPIHVAKDDVTAFAQIEPALRTLWRRFRAEGKIDASRQEPRDVRELCAHPINFVVGGPDSVARQLLDLHGQCPYDVANIEVRWDGLSDAHIHDCMRHFAQGVRPLIRSAVAALNS